MSKKILRFDATALRESSCELKFSWNVISGYREPAIFNDTQYGTALHKFLYVMAITGGDFKTALYEATQTFSKHNKVRDKKDHLNKTHLAQTCFDYWEWIATHETDFELYTYESECFYCKGNPVQIDESGNEVLCEHCKGTGIKQRPLVEVTFDIPILQTEYYDINIAGTIDRIGKIRNGCSCIRDYKTTSNYKIAQFLKSFRGSTQLKLYKWALNKMAQLHPESPVAEIVKHQVGVAIDGIFLKSAKETEFKASEVYIVKDDEMEIFGAMLEFKAHELGRLYEQSLENVKPFPTGMVEGLCGSFLMCKYFDVCHAPDDISREHILRNRFKQIEYNPLTFGEIE